METNKRPNLTDLINDSTTPDEFETLVSSLLTDEDSQLLGDEGKSKAVKALLYLGVFAPEPATFNREAYNAIVAVDDDGTPYAESERAHLFYLARELGIIKESGEDRLVTNAEASRLLSQILEKYPNDT